MRGQIYVNMKNFSQQLSNIIDNHINEMLSTLVQLSGNKDVVLYMYNDFSNDYERQTSNSDLLKNLTSIKTLKKDSEIYLVPFKNDIKTIGMSGIKSIDEIMGNSEYRSFIESDKSVDIFNGLPASKESKTFMAAIKFPLYTAPSTGLILISQGVSVFDDILDNTNFKSSLDSIIIMDRAGIPVYTSNEYFSSSLKLTDINPKINPQKSGDVSVTEINGAKYIITVNKSDLTGWSILSFTSEARILSQLKNLNFYIILVTILSMIAVFIFSYFTAFRLAVPIRRLTGLMRTAEEKNYNVSMVQESNDEIGEMAESFNHMMSVFLKNSILRKEAELKALQQQINPHFLYNTLDVINAYADLRGVKEISVISRNMGDIFRYAVSDEWTATVSDEVEYVQKYVDIYMIKNKGRFSINFDICDDVRHYMLEKFILQPLVENAISHGLQDVTENGLITMRLQKEKGYIRAEISDNGIGMDIDKLSMLERYMFDEVYEDLQTDRKSIGLRNVNLRLILKYGFGSRLKIASTPGEGTMIAFSIPVEMEV